MGNKSNKLKSTDVQSYVLLAKKRFSESEIKSLHNHFQTLSGIKKSDNLIDIEEFKMAFGLAKSNFFVERMFHIFDRNGDGKITFPEFLEGLSVLIYDVDEDGKISRSELVKMMKACLKCFPHPFSDSQITSIIDSTFKEGDLNKDGFIDFEEYSKLVESHPMMLNQMSINLSQRIKEMQKSDVDETSKKVKGMKI
eukprot:g3237.t1